MRSSETVAAIAPALVKALSELKGAPKDSKNPHFKNDYASLESVIETSRAVLASNDLAVFQGPGEMDGNRIAISTRILHASGEWFESQLQLPIAKVDPQGVGSAITYARRYALMAMLNIPAVDDDGEAASAHNDRTGDMGPAPEGEDFFGCPAQGVSVLSAYAAKKNGLDLTHDRMRGEIDTLSNGDALRGWIKANQGEIATMPRSWRVELRNCVDARASELGLTNDRRAA